MANNDSDSPVRRKVGSLASEGSPWLSVSTLVVAVIGLWLRVWVHRPTDLWQDEIIAATHAMQPFGDVILSAIRYDVHPPLYFIQLHFWSLFGHSDRWLMANSLLWSVAAILSFWIVVRRRFGQRVACISIITYALLPAPVYLADQVRMYGMLSVLFVWAFDLSQKCFFDQNRKMSHLIGLELVLVLMLLTHAIAAVAIASFATFSLLGAIKTKRFKDWLFIYGAASVFALPFVVGASLHDANLHQGTGIFSMVWAFSSSTIGIIGTLSEYWIAAGLLASAYIIYFGLRDADSRAIVLCLFVLPLLGSIILAVVFKPLYKWNFFSAFESPFIALTFGLILSKASRVPGALGIALVVVFAFASVSEKASFRESSGYRDASIIIKRNYQPGDIIYVPQTANFWGIAWYLLGPNWGSSLRVSAPPMGAWKKLYAKAGDRMLRRLGLIPTHREFHAQGFDLFVGQEANSLIPSATRIWLVVDPEAGDLISNYPPKALAGMAPQWKKTTHTEVILYAPRPQKILE